MQAHVTTETHVRLILTPDEAMWLRSVMQNPLYEVSPELEDVYFREMRKRFFEALSALDRLD